MTKKTIITLILAGALGLFSYYFIYTKSTTKKWIVPSESICQNEGGKFDDGVCKADWLKARRICRLSGGRLPNIDELKAEITSCGGKVGDWEDNIRNQSFLSCIKEKNFHDFENYWSLSLEKKEKDRVYMMNAAMSAGDIRKSYPIDDFPEAVMCVQEPNNNEQIQEDTHTDKWIIPENSICKKEGGKLDIGTCKANWQQAQNICRASGGVLPSIDELKAVVASCDGKIANSEAEQINNIKNTNYQQCYKQKGFSDLGYYWSSTDVGNPGARWRVNMWNGAILWNVESAHYYVRCVEDRKTDNVQSSVQEEYRAEPENSNNNIQIPKEENVVEEVIPVAKKKKIVEKAKELKAESVVTVADGAKLFTACSGCHGEKAEKKALGRSQVIAGWNSIKIINALKGYKKGSYGGIMKGLMQGQTSELNDTEIKALADYISKL